MSSDSTTIIGSLLEAIETSTVLSMLYRRRLGRTVGSIPVLFRSTRFPGIGKSFLFFERKD
jgi:hypothetical protein